MKSIAPLRIAAFLVLLAFAAAPLRAQSATYENVTVTGTGDFQGASTMFGSWTGGSGVAGLTINYSGTGATTAVNFIGSGTSTVWEWWQYNGSTNLPSLKLDQNNQLTIYTSGTGGTTGITLNPATSGTSSFAGSVTINGTDNELPSQVLVNGSSILTESLGDSRYLQNVSGGVLIGSTSGYGYGTGPTVSLGGGDASAPYTIAGLGGAQANYFGAIALGWGASATGEGGSTGIGSDSSASGYCSLSLGNASSASGAQTAAVGYAAYANGDYSLAAGYFANADGDYSMAIGQDSYTDSNGGYGGTAVGYVAYVDSADPYSGGSAFGNNVFAMGDYSTAIGYYTTANGQYSTAAGSYTTAAGCYQYVVGFNNIPQGDPANWVGSDQLFVVGNGAVEGASSNAFVVNKNGDTTVSGAFVVSGTSGNVNMIGYGGLIMTGTTVPVAVGSGTVNTMVATGTNNLLIIPQQGDISMGVFVAGVQPAAPGAAGGSSGGGGGGSDDMMSGGEGFGGGGSSGMSRIGGGGSGSSGTSSGTSSH